MIPALHGNWVDLLIILVLIFFIHQGFVNGFWSILIDFVAFFGSLLISLKIYKLGSNLLESNFSLNRPLANALGYLAVAVISEILISFALSYLIKKLPPKLLKNKFNKILGIMLSAGQGILFTAFTLVLAISLPINPAIKTDISNSKIGNFILSKTSGIEGSINNIFGGAINDSLTYMTVEPKSHESVPVVAKTENLTVDNSSETKMFQLVNHERTSRGESALTWDVKLVVVAENYARFMWQIHYFVHFDPEGHDVVVSLKNTNIDYQI